jgi:predicted permease
MTRTQQRGESGDRHQMPAVGTVAQLLVQDVRYGLRMLRKSPGFTVVAVLTLALGIGANTAIFSLLNQVLLQTLPVKSPRQLVLLDAPGPNSGSIHGDNAFSYPMYRDIRDQNSVFSGALGLWGFDASLSYDRSTERVRGELVTGNYFDVLGVRPTLGRAFTPDDDINPAGHPLVMLSYSYWQRRFGGNRSILGQAVDVNSLPLTIIGVAPPGFFGLEVGNATDIFVPMMMKAAMTPGWDGMNDRRDLWLNIFARLDPAQRPEQAEAAMNVLFHQILEGEAQDPRIGSSFRERFVAKHLYLRDGSRGRSSLREHFATPLLVLMGFVAIVLLIVCANIASLLMTRGAARQKEMAIRLALGAGRGRITRQLLVESILLACIGGGLGIVLALWVGSALLRMTPAQPQSLTFSASPDAGVLIFTFAVSVFTGVLFGLIPAIQGTRQAVAQTLRSEATSVAGGRTHARLRKVLVTAQVALSLLLLIGAGLFARSLYNLRTLDTGFKADHLLEFSIDPSLNGYDDPREVVLFSQLQDRIKNLAGVKGVSAADIAPVSGDDNMSTISVEGYQAKEQENMNPNVNHIGADYFATLGVPLVMGREFTAADAKGAPKVGIINEKARDYWFHGENPLGRHFGFGGRRGNPDIEIVGVVKDTREHSLRDEIPRFVYTPYMQGTNIGQLSFLIRTSRDPSALAPLVRQEIGNLDSSIPVFNIKTMDTQLDEALYTERMIAMLSVLFGGLAALLAAIGLYGVMSYNVARRTAEIGIRMALGASRGSAVWLVMREVVLMAGAGIVIAVPLALVLAGYVRSQLYGLAATDALTLILATGLLAGVSLVAGFVPGFRASRINPIQALRYE